MLLSILAKSLVKMESNIGVANERDTHETQKMEDKPCCIYLQAWGFIDWLGCIFILELFQL